MQSSSLCLILCSGLICSGIISCNDHREVPFPMAESSFAQPVTKPFHLAGPDTIRWNLVNPDSIRALPVSRVDYNKIPSKAFNIGEAQPLRKPMAERKFDLNSFQDTIFNLKALPTNKIRYRTVLLAEPKLVRAGMPTLAVGASRGIMSLGTDMGLPSGVRCFIQDEDGLMWIGTDKGLFRYDGQTLLNYGLEQGLSEMDIFSLVEDDQHQIWIGGSRSLQVLNRKAGLVSTVMDTLATGNVIGLMKARDGMIWITSPNRPVLIIDPAMGVMASYSVKAGLNNGFALRSLQDSTGLIWITTGNGLNVIDLEKGRSKKIQRAEGLNGEVAYNLALDKQHRIWVGLDSGVSIIDNNRHVISNIDSTQGLPNVPIGAIRTASDGITWFGSFDGKLYSFNEAQKQLETYQITDVNFSIIYNITESADRQLWIGSIRGGGYVLNLANGRPGNFSKTNGLTDNRVWSLLEDSSGRIWMGSYNGIDIYDPRLKIIRHLGRETGLAGDRNTTLYEVQPGEIWATGSSPVISIINLQQGTIRRLSSAEGLIKDGYSSVVKDRSGVVWIGTDQGNIIAVDLPRKMIKSFKLSQPGVKSEILSLRLDRNGHIWAGSLGSGAFIIDPVSNTFWRLNVAEGLLHEQVTTFMEDRKGNMWIGTENGISVVDPGHEKITSITMKEGLASKGCYTIDQVDSAIYVGTSNGITVMPGLDGDNSGWFAKTYGKGQGLAFVDVAQNSSLVTRGKLYLAGIDNQVVTVFNTLKPDAPVNRAHVTGINLFDRPQKFYTPSFFDQEVQHVDTLWKAENGTYYTDKLVAADNRISSVVGVKWDSTSSAYSMPVNLQLPYNQNYLSFNFNGIHLSNPDKARYRYILQGIDKNWSPVTEESRSENYRDLPAGKYVFRVSTAGMDGKWSEPSAFEFSIHPPIWKTWWAYTIYLLLAGLAVYSLAKFRLRTLERQNKHLEEKVTHRTEALNKSLNELKATQSQLIQSEKMASLGELTAGIAHEIQNPLNFVNNFSEINAELIGELKDELTKGNLDEAKTIADHVSENERKISHHGKRAEAIVRSMLQHSRSGNGQKEPTDINALADEYFRLSYHGLRAKDKSFNAGMQTHFEQGLGLMNLRGQDIGRVLLNLVNNAFYAVTEKAKAYRLQGIAFDPIVSISTRYVIEEAGKKQVLISARDNGNGIPTRMLDKIFQPFFTTKPTGEGTGLGLSLAYDIIKSHGGSLSVDTKEGEFTEFKILLPVT